MGEEGGEGILIGEGKCGDGMKNEKVKVGLCGKGKKDEVEGEVMEILEEGKERFVGVLKVSKNYGLVVRERRRVGKEMFMGKEKVKGGKKGDKGIVGITEWGEEGKNGFGEVMEMVGKGGEKSSEMEGIVGE